MDVGGWLRRLGLEQYEAAFRENKIDEIVLPRLTAEDLKDLGVGFVGDRRKLLDAIATLRTEASAPTPLSDVPLATDKAARDSAERRQVTVMFSDLVGSTALSARMDPEDLREVISTYQRCVADTVGRFGGFLAKYMGDGVLIYFGYPEAHEDDAERAVRAGLALIDAVATLPTPEPVQVRIGVATGMVVVGDLVGSGEAQERGIVGETPNLAARLQGIAESNTVVIAEATRRLLGNLFELRDLGSRELKGITGPVRAFAALRASSVESRFEAMHPGGLTALVGREEELDLLLRRWVRAKAGEGQVVLLSGEAGIGKSRLSAALMEAIAAEPHTRLRYFCSPQHTDSAFYPIIGQFERAAGFAHGDAPQAKLDKLDALLAQTATSKQDAALLAEMLSLPNDGRYPTLNADPEQRRQKTLAALDLQLETLIRSSPVLMILDDAHWSDPTSLEAFGRTVDRVRTLRVLLIVTFRPEFQAPWVGQPHVTALTINRLAEREIGTMIDRVVGNKPLPANIRKDIIERTDGIPLFVEEMTKAVLEAGGELEAIHAAAAVHSSAVPASLQASLMARLDRLSPAKEVAQIGAAIGREFSYDLISTVSALSEQTLQTALALLVGAEVIFQRGKPPYATYLFKHALVQETAYTSLLRSRRQKLHGQIAQALETRSDTAEPEILAYHFTEANLLEPAVDYWHKAGERYLRRPAYVEAVKHLSRAIELLRTMPETKETLHEQLEICIKMGPALVAMKGAGSQEVESIYRRAVELTDQLERTTRRFPALWGLWYVNYSRANYAAAREIGERLLDAARTSGDTGQILEAHHALWAVLSAMGRAAEAVLHMERGLALYDQVPHVSQTYLYGGHDAGACCRYHLTVNLWLLGYPDRSLQALVDALRLSEELKHPLTRMVTLWYVAWVHSQRGERAAVRAKLEELLALGKEHGISSLMDASFFLLDTDTAFGKQGLASLIERLQETWASASWHRVFCMCVLAQRCIDEHHTVEGLSILASISADDRRAFYAPEMHRLEGELRRGLPSPDAKEIETCFRVAVTLANQRKEKSLELRAAVSLARFWRDQGKRDEARDLLAPVYGWFTEGFDTVDLKQAKTLLDELA